MTEEMKKSKESKKFGIVHEFKLFINRGSVVDVAVAFVMGAAFKTIVDAVAGDGKDNAGLTNSGKDLNVLLDRVTKVTDKDQLNILMRELVATMVSLSQTVTSVQGDTTVTLENLRQASEQLNEFTRIASQSPSTLIWGEPPARITPPMNGAEK